MTHSNHTRLATLNRRRFLAAAGMLSGGLCSDAAGILDGPAIAAPNSETVGDRLWLWGHPAGCHTRNQEQWGIPGKSRITQSEAAAFMDLSNLLMVRYELEPKPPLVDHARPLRKLDRVVWSAEGGGGDDVESVLALRDTLPNLCGVMLDDYFGRVTALAPRMWLAENNVTFPVSLTLTFPETVRPDRIELRQSNWNTGDYRSHRFAIDFGGEQDDWTEAAQGSLPNAPSETTAVKLPASPVRRIRIRILDTHDRDKAKSCGLSGIRLWAGGKEIARRGVQVRASSEYPAHPAANLVAEPGEDLGPFSLSALKRLRQRLNAGPRPLDLWVVLYTHEFGFGPLLKPHLELCDVVTMWTWQAQDLPRLEENFREFEKIVGPKRKVLGLYMWDYGTHKPMPVPLMQRQCALGLRWLREGRIDGMIFLASCICDLDLEAVRYSRQWIAEHRRQAIR